MNILGNQELYDIISNNVFNIDIPDLGLFQVGTGFAISATKFVTAYHNLNELDNGAHINLVHPSMNTHTGRIVDYSETADLAVIEIDSGINNFNPFTINENPPSLGSFCIWGGYANLVGETSSRRVRFGHGMTCSKPYGTDEVTFFEIDGIFNTGYSVSTVLNTETNQVVGVVSRSAGDVLEYLQVTRTYMDALQILSKDMKFLEDIVKSIDQLVSAAGTFAISPSADWSTSVDGNLPERIKRIFEEYDVGMTILQKLDWLPDDGDAVQTRIMSSVPVLLRTIIGIILRLLKTNQSAIDESFQMGVGVVTGGQQMIDFIQRHL